MPVCCRCNGSGHCKTCSCVKSGKPCLDCLPSRNGHCNNNNETHTSTNSEHHPPMLLPPIPPSLATTATLDSPRYLAEATTPSPNMDMLDAILDDVTPDTHALALPSFKPMSCLNCTWGDLSGQEFSDAIDNAYSQMVHWRPNLFKVPSGTSGKHLVAELARLFEAFAAESAFEAFAVKAAMTLPALVLQEGKAIQKSLNVSLSSRRDVKDDATTARKFSQLMMEGRVRAALQLLTKETRSGLLSLDEVISDGSGKTVRDVLEDKHPDPEPIHADAILNEDTTNADFPPILFDSITAEVIRSSALHTEGSAGPSGVDARFTVLITVFPIILRTTSPIPTGRTPGHLSSGTRTRCRM